MQGAAQDRQHACKKAKIRKHPSEGESGKALIMCSPGEDGFWTKNVANVAGHIEYGSGEGIIGILCHVDVVPAQGNWTFPPFSGTVSGGRIYSRGASDDKGPTIAALYALKALKDMGFQPKKRIRLIIGTDEESHWRGIKKYFQECEMPDLGFSPDAAFPVIYGRKGHHVD